MWGWKLAYALGVTPWERAGVAGHDQLLALVRSAAPDPPPGARALDVGCGTGAHAVALAQRGWQVTGIDPVAKALARARRRSEEAGVDVAWVQGLVEDMTSLVEPGVRLVLDIGCFHGLDEPAHDAWARAVDAVTEPGGSVVVLAFSPQGRRPPGLPRGASVDDVTRRLPRWSLTARETATTDGMPRPLRSLAPSFVVLQKAYARQPDSSTPPGTSVAGS